eukprot:scaffold261_cov169-Ochromonas_danica.AAC.6
MKSSSSSSSGPSDPEERHYDVMPHTTQKMLAALFYGISSILVIFTNKWLMNGFNFPYIDFIATIQFIVTTVILFSLIMMKKIEVPPLSWTIVCEVLPITIMFLEVENDGTTSAVVAAAAMGAGTGVGGSPSLRGGVDSTSFALHTTDTISLVFQHPGWHDSRFLLMMILSACMGSILNYSILLCTTINSALTTAVVGTTKNIATTYIGMVAFSDYSFNWINFLGINVSIIGSIYYSYITIFKGASGYGQA